MKLGILQINPDLAIFQKSAVRILNYRSSLLCSELSGFSFIFSILAYSRRAIKYAVQLEFYCTATTSVSIIWYRSKMYTAGSTEDDYCSVKLRALPIVLHILIGINSTLVPFVFILPLIEIARTQFFVRWMECNTPLPEYVLSCVFRFFDRIF